MSRSGRWIALGVLALAVAGAALLAWRTFAIGQSSGPAAILADTHWSLVSINGQAPIAGRALTLNLQPAGQLAGNSGCNSFSGRYQITGSTFIVSQLVSTERACAEQPLNDQESAFQKALGGTAQFGLSGGRLTLQNAGASQELIFQKQ